jgi:hypothetical protein
MLHQGPGSCPNVRSQAGPTGFKPNDRRRTNGRIRRHSADPCASRKAASSSGSSRPLREPTRAGSGRRTPRHQSRPEPALVAPSPSKPPGPAPRGPKEQPRNRRETWRPDRVPVAAEPEPAPRNLGLSYDLFGGVRSSSTSLASPSIARRALACSSLSLASRSSGVILI